MRRLSACWNRKNVTTVVYDRYYHNISISTDKYNIEPFGYRNYDSTWEILQYFLWIEQIVERDIMH